MVDQVGSQADAVSAERTLRLIFRPSVTSSGRTWRNSSTQAMLCASVPRVDTTSCMTSFHSIICIARLARQTHNCVLIGLGPAPKFESRDRRVYRKEARDSRGSWCRSYVIYGCELAKEPKGTRMVLPCLSALWQQIAGHLQSRSALVACQKWRSMPRAARLVVSKGCWRKTQHLNRNCH